MGEQIIEKVDEVRTLTREVPGYGTFTYLHILDMLAMKGVEEVNLDSAKEVQEVMQEWVDKLDQDHIRFIAALHKGMPDDTKDARKDRLFRGALQIEDAAILMAPCVGYTDSDGELQVADGHTDVFSIGTPGALYEKSRCAKCQAAWAVANGKSKGSVKVTKEQKLLDNIARTEQAIKTFKAIKADTDGLEKQKDSYEKQLEKLRSGE